MSQSIGGCRIAPDLTEAARLIARGMHLVRLVPNSKRPVGVGWNRRRRLTKVDPESTGYGMPLALNGRCSIDPDNVEQARVALAALGFDLEALMAAGVRTASTRPGSGGRSTFLAQEGLTWVTFTSSAGSVLELRATTLNLQDCVPGVVYIDKQGEMQTQTYANGKRLDDGVELPEEFAAWWRRCSQDRDFLWSQQRRVAQALGDTRARLSLSTGAEGEPLAFRSEFRHLCPATVEDLLERHGYQQHGDRWSAPQSTGAPGIRKIEGTDLWESSHGSDLLQGTFDAWAAYVQLDHAGDLAAAEAAAQQAWQERMTPLAQLEAAYKAQEAALEAERVAEVVASIEAGGAPPGWITMAELMKPREPEPMLVEGVIERGALTMVYGAPSTWKSFTFCVGLGMSVATGLPWMGRVVEQGPVGIVAGEGADGLASRIQGWVKHHGTGMGAPLYLRDSGGNLTSEEDMAKIAASFPLGLKLVIFDTLRTNVAGKFNENDANDFGTVTRLMRQHFTSKGTTVVLIHHENKAGDFSGSGALFANCDNFIRQTSTDANMGAEIAVLKVKKMAKPEPFRVRGRLVTLDNGTSTVVFEGVVGALVSALNAPRLTAMGDKWWTRKELEGLWSVGEARVRALLQELGAGLEHESGGSRVRRKL